MDAFVVKVNASATGLVYAGPLGGSADDFASDIAVDSSGNAYITGSTESTEAAFPATVGPDLTFNGDDDAFVAKLDAGGKLLLYAGYFGGTDIDSASGIALDAAGNAYVSGSTTSTEASFPVSVGPDLTHNGDFDTFLAVIAEPIPLPCPVETILSDDPDRSLILQLLHLFRDDVMSRSPRGDDTFGSFTATAGREVGCSNRIRNCAPRPVRFSGGYFPSCGPSWKGVRRRS